MTTESSAFKIPTNLYQLIDETFKLYEERKLINTNCCEVGGDHAMNDTNNSYANCLIILLNTSLFRR